jgi:hypothetical protein
VGLSAIFCLQMEREVSDFEIGVVPEDHDPHSLPVVPPLALLLIGLECLAEHLTGGVSLDIITL